MMTKASGGSSCLTQLGNDLVVYRNNQLLRCVLAPTFNSRKLAALEDDKNGEEIDGEQMRCFPSIPLFKDPVKFIGANSLADRLVVASARQVVVVQNHQSNTHQASLLHGTSTGRNGNKLILRSGHWKQGFVMEGEFDVGKTTFAGRMDIVEGNRSGTFSLKLTHRAGDNFGSRDLFYSGDRWTGTCRLSRKGVLPPELPMEMVIERSGNGQVVASIGDSFLELVDKGFFNATPDTIVDIAWHPTIPYQLVVLTKGGNVRVYDCTAGLEEPVLDINVLKRFGKSMTSCSSMSFGTNIACRDKLSSCSAVTLFRRMTLYILCENGAVLGLCPIGAYANCTRTNGLNELILLRDVIQKEMQQQQGGHGDFDKELEWIERTIAAEGKASIFTPEPVLVVSPTNCPDMRETASLTPQPSSGSNAIIANSLVVVPSVNTPVVSFLRSWTCGRVDSLIGGEPILPLWAEQSAQQRRRLQAIENGLVNTPIIGGGKLDMRMKGSLSASSEDGRRDSPLRNLSAKINRACENKNSPLNNMLRRESSNDDEEEMLSPLQSRSAKKYYGSPNAPRFPDTTPTKALNALTRFPDDSYDDDDSDEEDDYYDDHINYGGNPDEFSGTRVTTQPVLVGCMEVMGGCSFKLMLDPVCQDFVLAIDVANGTIHLLWLPWVQRSWEESLQHNYIGKLLSGVLPGVRSQCFPGGKHSVAVIAQPGVGHVLHVSIIDGGEVKILRFELSAEYVNLRTNLAVSLAQNRTKQSNLLLTETVEDDDSGDDVEELDELLAHFNQQMVLLTTVPKSLGGVEVIGKNSPALSLALCSWLHDLSDSLLYGKSGSTGLMQGIRIGFELIERRRDEQDKTLEMQRQVLTKAFNDLAYARDGLDNLGKMSQGIIELQDMTEESLEFCNQQSQALCVGTTEAEREFARLISNLDERLERLRSKVGNGEDTQGLGKMVKTIEEEEKFLQDNGQKQYQEQYNFVGTEYEKEVQKLQSRTHDLISEMTDVPKMENRESLSIYSLRKRWNHLRSTFNAAVKSSVTPGSLVMLVATNSEPAQELAKIIEEMENIPQTDMFIDRKLLDRAYQSTLRRRFGLHAKDCPYVVDMVQEHGKPQVNVILLDDKINVDETNGNINIARKKTFRGGEFDDEDEEGYDEFDDTSTPEQDSLQKPPDGVKVILVTIRDQPSVNICDDTGDVYQVLASLANQQRLRRVLG